MNPKPRLAVLTDFPEEGWPSMDLCGDMLLAHLPREGPLAVEAGRLCPPFRRLATRLPAVCRRNAAFNADRLLNRFVWTPFWPWGENVGLYVWRREYSMY